MKRFLELGLALVLVLCAAGSVASAQQCVASVCSVCKQTNACKSDCVQRESRCEQFMGRNVKYSKGYVYTWQGFPGNVGAPSSALMLLEKRAPEFVYANDSFTYEIQVSNRSPNLLGNVVVKDRLPDGFVLDSVEPEVSEVDRVLTFSIAELPPRTAKCFQITGRVPSTGCVAFCGTASASFEYPLNIVVKSVECRLELSLTIVDECIDICAPTVAKICVKNPSGVPSYENCVTVNLPDGLVTDKGETNPSWLIPLLGPGEAKTLTFNVNAKKVGIYDVFAQVRNSRGCGASDMAKMKAIAPNVVISKSGPAKAYLGHEAIYTITVSNQSVCPAKDVTVVDVWSGAAAKLLSATPKAASGRGNKLVWKLERSRRMRPGRWSISSARWSPVSSRMSLV